MRETTQFKNLGYVLLEDALDVLTPAYIKADAISLFVKQMTRLEIDTCSFESNAISLYSNHRDVFMNCLNLANRTTGLLSLATDKRILDICYRLGLQFPILIDFPQIEMHNETFPDLLIGTETGILTSKGLNLVIPLTDCVDADWGFMRLVPGSHNEENPSIAYSHNESDYITISANVGDVLVMDPVLTSEYTPNKHKGAIRWNALIEYADANEPGFLINGFC